MTWKKDRKEAAHKAEALTDKLFLIRHDQHHKLDCQNTKGSRHDLKTRTQREKKTQDDFK
jgi:hypothetical protein